MVFVLPFMLGALVGLIVGVSLMLPARQSGLSGNRYQIEEES